MGLDELGGVDEGVAVAGMSEEECDGACFEVNVRAIDFQEDITNHSKPEPQLNKEHTAVDVLKRMQLQDKEENREGFEPDKVLPDIVITAQDNIGDGDDKVPDVEEAVSFGGLGLHRMDFVINILSSL